jgi:hypothetical protein
MYTPGVSRAQDAGAGSNPEGCDQPLARKVLLSWTRLPRAFAGACKIIARPCILAGHDFAKAKSLPAHAAWIAAEIPQDLHRQIRGIGAVGRGERSTPRFFCPYGQKSAPKIERTQSTITIASGS